jgi:hypothetical protein
VRGEVLEHRELAEVGLGLVAVPEVGGGCLEERREFFFPEAERG